MGEISKEVVDKTLDAIGIAKATGKIKKGTNEVTKTIERGLAKLVVIAKDPSPPEIVMHIPLLSEEKGVVAVIVPTKEELGAAAGIAVPTASVAIIEEGEAKKLVAEIVGEVGKTAEKEVPEEKKEEKKEAPEEAKKEEKKEEKTE